MSIDITRYFTKKEGRSVNVMTEGVNERRNSLDLDIEDVELAKIIDSRISESAALKSQIDKINEMNENFYLGNQLDESKLHDHQAKIVSNRIFLAIETIVPILATKKRDPIVMAAQQTDESRELALLTQDYLSWKWNEQRMLLKLTDIIKFNQLYRLCALKYRFVGEPYNDYIVELKRPECLIIDNKANEDDVEFIGEYCEDTIKGLFRKFTVDNNGKENKSKQEEILRELSITKDQLDTKVTYLEFWTNEFVVWKLRNVILDKRKNPNWFWGEKKYNHFLTPQKPYILFRNQSLLKNIYSDTTALEQSKPLQMNINKRKRQISDNADQASGTFIFNEKFISKKEAAKFVGAPNQHIMYNGEQSPNEVIGRIYPKELGQQVFVDLQDDKSEIDNIFGTHSTTRGERTGQKTAREATMLRESDFGRLDLQSQYIDMKVESLFNAFVQMSLVYYDKMKTIKILGADRAEKYIEFNRNNIEDGIEVIVKTEPLLAKAEESEKYMMMFQAGLIDPLTMYEKMNLANPKELTRRNLIYKIDPRVYMAQFAVDENTPGMENDPVNVAKEDIKRIEDGVSAPPFEKVNKDHIIEHQKYLKTSKFKKLKDEIKKAMIDHIRAELEILKGKTEQVSGQPTPAVEQPAGVQGEQPPQGVDMPAQPPPTMPIGGGAAPPQME